jgi:hypothetical protein
MFIGVPYSSDENDFRALLAKITRAMLPHASQELLCSVEQCQTMIRDLANDFDDLGEKIKIVTCCGREGQVHTRVIVLIPR